MSGTLKVLATGVLFLPAATILFVRMFWNEYWTDRVKTTFFALGWGVAHILWFVGGLIVLPAWYLRSAYEADLPQWALLLPFAASVIALLCFARGSFKKLAAILASRGNSSGQRKKKKLARLIFEGLVLFGVSASGITLVFWNYGRVANWGDLGRLLPFYLIIAACVSIYVTSHLLASRR